MKKLIIKIFALLLFVLPSLMAVGQSTDAQLTTQANVIRNETSSGGNTKGRIADMFQALINSKESRIPVGIVTGTNSYSLTAGSYVTSYATSRMFIIQTTNTNSGASTLNVNSLGAVALKRNNGDPLEAGDFEAGGYYIVIHNGTNFRVINIGESGGGSNDLVIEDITGTTYTLDDTDNNKLLFLTNAAGCVVTLDDGVTAPLTATFLRDFGAGETSFVAGGTASLNAIGGDYTIQVEGGAAQWIKRNGTAFYGIGNIGPVASGGGGTQDLESVLTEGNDAGGLAIENLADPTNPQDAATKQSVDDAIAAIDAYGTVQDTGTPVTQRSTINFTGGLTAYDNSGVTNVVFGGQANATTLDFASAGSGTTDYSIGTTLLPFKTFFVKSTEGVFLKSGSDQVSFGGLVFPNKAYFDFASGVESTTPYILPGYATGSLPSAVTFSHGVVFDTTTGTFKYSNGSAWVAPGSGSGSVTIVTGTSPIVITSTATTTPNVTINNAAADGSTKGAAAFNSSDFDASSGVISIDYTNGQSASGSTKGLVTSTDWNTFNNKQAALTLGTNVLTALGVNVGTAGAFVVNGGVLGTPSSGTATNLTGLPISTGLTGAGTGILAALAVNIGSAGAPVLFNGAGGAPSSIVLTNGTGTASGLTAGNVTTNANLTGHVTSTGNATVLGSFSSSNLSTALTDEVGTGLNVFSECPTRTVTGTTDTPVLADRGSQIVFTNAGSITLTLPTNASVAYPTGTEIWLKGVASGVVTVAAPAGGSVSNTAGNLLSPSAAGTDFSMIVKKTGTNTWTLDNGTAPTTAAFTRTNGTYITTTLAGSMSGALNTAVDITVDLTGIVPVSLGGTGVSSTTQTYTPTLTNTTNVAASTARLCTYMRVGNTITVAGQLDIDPTTTLTATTLGISLPIASALTTAFQVGGVASSIAVTDSPAGIQGDATNDRAILQYICTDTTNHTMTFTFTYQVL